MGLFDRLPGRLFGSRPGSIKVSGESEASKPKKEQGTFFLDPDASSSLGDISYMRRSNTIRHTFPGNADSPGQKEMVAEVASMEARLERMTPGLAGTPTSTDTEVDLTGGVPKQVKKTFAQQISSSQLEQRLKGSAVKGVNEAAAAGPARKEKGEGDDQTRSSQLQSAKPGTTDPFRSMAKDLNV